MPDAEGQRTYLLHMRRYTDTRSILELFTEHLGRMAVVARTGGKRSPHYLHFKPAQVSWRGQGELKTLVSYESLPIHTSPLLGTATYCGLYVNELLQRLVPVADPCLTLFQAYETCLTHLGKATSGGGLESALRRFELELLAEMGVSLEFSVCASSGEPVDPEKAYRLVQESGFEPSLEVPEPKRKVFAGQDLLAIAERDFSTPETLRAAKTITRLSLAPLLGSKPLKSREFFQ